MLYLTGGWPAWVPYVCLRFVAYLGDGVLLVTRCAVSSTRAGPLHTQRWGWVPMLHTPYIGWLRRLRPENTTHGAMPCWCNCLAGHRAYRPAASPAAPAHHWSHSSPSGAAVALQSCVACRRKVTVTRPAGEGGDQGSPPLAQRLNVTCQCYKRVHAKAPYDNALSCSA